MFIEKSTVWEGTNGCENNIDVVCQIYLMAVSSDIFAIMMYHGINAPGHGNNVVGGLNSNDKRYMNEQMEIVGHLKTNDISNVVMIKCDLKWFYQLFITMFTYYHL